MNFFCVNFLFFSLILTLAKGQNFQCPTVTQLGDISTCVDQCTDDSNCSGDQKCCQSPCGKACTMPVQQGECKDKIPDENMCKIAKASGVCVLQKKLMAANCRKTCGFCQQTSYSFCKDQATESECQNWKSSQFCESAQSQKIMKQICKKTCGFCTNSSSINAGCVDRSPNCKMLAQFNQCQNPSLQHFIRFCPLSCNQCGSVGSNGNDLQTLAADCSDSAQGRSMCPTIKRKGMCNSNQAQLQAMISKNCKKTCNLCSSNQQYGNNGQNNNYGQNRPNYGQNNNWQNNNGQNRPNRPNNQGQNNNWQNNNGQNRPNNQGQNNYGQGPNMNYGGNQNQNQCRNKLNSRQCERFVQRNLCRGLGKKYCQKSCNMCQNGNGNNGMNMNMGGRGMSQSGNGNNGRCTNELTRWQCEQLASKGLCRRFGKEKCKKTCNFCSNGQNMQRGQQQRRSN